MKELGIDEHGANGGLGSKTSFAAGPDAVGGGGREENQRIWMMIVGSWVLRMFLGEIQEGQEGEI